MTINSEQKSAVILTFPKGGRSVPAAYSAPQQRVAKVASGSSWYHDAAIEEDDKTTRQ